MSKEPKHKFTKKLPPIVIVPDKSYIDDTGHLIVTDVLVLVDTISHQNLLMAAQKEIGPREDIIKAKMNAVLREEP